MRRGKASTPSHPGWPRPARWRTRHQRMNTPLAPAHTHTLRPHLAPPPCAQGFALFTSAAAAHFAVELVGGAHFDDGGALRAELAAKNMSIKVRDLLFIALLMPKGGCTAHYRGDPKGMALRGSCRRPRRPLASLAWFPAQPSQPQPRP
jgi:hypothetical protein